MIRTLTTEANEYKDNLIDMLNASSIDIEYSIKHYADNHFTVVLERTDMVNEDEDTIELELTGNYDCVFVAVEAWIESEENR